MDPSETSVIEAIRRGDVNRYGELVGRHKDQVYGVLKRIVGDEHVAEELAQTAFVQAYEGLGRFRGEASFATWVTQIAIHLARTSLRRNQKAVIISLDELLERQQEPPSEIRSRALDDPFENLVQSELEERLETAIVGLTDDYREVFVLRHLEDMSYEQISTLTGHSVGALKVRVHRARKQLLEQLSQQEGESGIGRLRP